MMRTDDFGISATGDQGTFPPCPHDAMPAAKNCIKALLESAFVRRRNRDASEHFAPGRAIA